ncbi:hypothetical protein T484DRAFT_1793767 [Baffinella frigidus]|nr:hypothetical protein T484DRAFT_1793767 [Cryptophyta sp. CCMP2293]
MAGGAWVYLAGGTADDGPLDSVLRFDSRKAVYTRLPSLPCGARFAAGAAVIDGGLFVMGGYSGARLRRVERLQIAGGPEGGGWSEVADMVVPRSDMAVAVCEGKILVVGGDTHEVECYSSSADEWRSAAPLPAPRTSCRACTLADAGGGGGEEGGVLVIGGFDPRTDDILASALRFAPGADKWLLLPPMKEVIRGQV